MKHWEAIFSSKMAGMAGSDSAHDFLHFQRVVNTAKQLCEEQGADVNVVVPAAWLHDLFLMPKDDPLRSQASRMAAKAALKFLESVGYPAQFYEGIAHAIESHSYSANIPPRTISTRLITSTTNYF